MTVVNLERLREPGGLLRTLEDLTADDLRALEECPPEQLVPAILGADFVELSMREKAARVEYLRDIGDAIRTDWHSFARDEQRIPPGDWYLWVVMAGRGFGKTRTGAESTRERIEQALARRIGIIGRTAGDVREVMVEGPSGILSVFPRWDRPKYEPSKRRITFGGTKGKGAIATTYSADEPDLLRGPEHDWIWGDEWASWQHLDETTDNMILGLRYGQDPRGVLTTTPRPRKRVRETISESTTHVTRGSTYRNLANLAAPFAAYIRKRFEGRRVGQQELHGILLETVEGALWQREWYERDGFRIPRDRLPDLDRIVVAMDPAVTSGEDADDTGIVVMGIAYDETIGLDRGYVLHSEAMHDRPAKCMRRVARLYREWRADRVIFEANNGGDYLPDLLATVDPRIPSSIVTATRGKKTRAEPVAGLYESSAISRCGLIHHVGQRNVDLHTAHAELEDQQTTYTGKPAEDDDESPDIMDALVWAATYLMIDDTIARRADGTVEDTRARGRR